MGQKKPSIVFLQVSLTGLLTTGTATGIVQVLKILNVMQKSNSQLVIRNLRHLEESISARSCFHFLTSTDFLRKKEALPYAEERCDSK